MFQFFTAPGPSGPIRSNPPGPSTMIQTLGPGAVIGPGPALPPVPTEQQPGFICPRRPNVGVEGRAILLRANHFQISVPRGFIHHYDITIQPDKCPRKVNR